MKNKITRSDAMDKIFENHPDYEKLYKQNTPDEVPNNTTSSRRNNNNIPNLISTTGTSIVSVEVTENEPANSMSGSTSVKDASTSASGSTSVKNSSASASGSTSVKNSSASASGSTSVKDASSSIKKNKTPAMTTPTRKTHTPSKKNPMIKNNNSSTKTRDRSESKGAKRTASTLNLDAYYSADSDIDPENKSGTISKKKRNTLTTPQKTTKCPSPEQEMDTHEQTYVKIPVIGSKPMKYSNDRSPIRRSGQNTKQNNYYR